MLASSMARVKGLAFRSVLVALQELEGEEAVARARSLLKSDTAEVLAALAASSWYSVAHYVELWRAILAATGQRKDLPRRVGFRAVEQDLNMIHRLAFSALSVSSVLAISSRLFGTYYDTGRCRSESIGPRAVRVSFDGCTGFSEAMWTELRGASECFAEKSSKTRSSSHLVSGGRDGSSECVLDVRWFAAADLRTPGQS